MKPDPFLMKRPTIDRPIGGDTPFVPFSDGPAAFGPDHKPFRIEIDGKEMTRDTHCIICAMTRRMMILEPTGGLDTSEHLSEFMVGVIAGANHDLRALGLGPLISIEEVELLSEHPQIVAAVEARRPAR